MKKTSLPDSYEEFAQAARQRNHSIYEVIGFPDEYRKGRDGHIFNDLMQKIPMLRKPCTRVLDIGAGCSDLSNRMISHAVTNKQALYLIDSQEMLARLPEQEGIIKVPGRFPEDHASFVRTEEGLFDVILCYSVLQYIVAEGSCFFFIDQAVRLLAPGGSFLIGDIPNASTRNRLLRSNEGREFHSRQYAGQPYPDTSLSVQDKTFIDDGVVLGVLARYRNLGFNTYVLPQPPTLPMANRREDILITRYQ